VLALAAALLPACNAELACGPGTRKQDGYCIGDTDAETDAEPDDDDTASATNSASAASDDDDGNAVSGTSDGFGSTGSSVQYYAACFAGSDAECWGSEECMESFNTCANPCTFDDDCPDPPDGTAVQRCEEIAGGWSEICVLYCGVEGSTCPTGTVCRETELCPDDGDADSSTGIFGTTGGDCEFSTLPICVWE
jgi:hypothetical protein